MKNLLFKVYNIKVDKSYFNFEIQSCIWRSTITMICALDVKINMSHVRLQNLTLFQRALYEHLFTYKVKFNNIWL